MRSVGDTRLHPAPHGTAPGTALPTLGVLLAAILLVAGCSTGASPSDALSPTAAEVLARVDAPSGEQAPLDPGEVAVPEGCRLVIETDEYDFETEVAVCDQEPTATGPDSGVTNPEARAPADLEGWAGSEDARAMARRLRDVIVGQTGCDSPQDLITVENLALAAPVEISVPLLAAVQDLRRSAALCNIDLTGWRNALENALDDLGEVVSILKASQ